MIETFFSSMSLATPAAFLCSFIIGIAFGWCLEQAGLGSSRRLAGIFYFTDLTVIKVMFSAVVTAMLGLAILLGSGILSPDSIYIPETFLWAQVVGGLIFGMGFVVGGWCPGTAAVGFVSGRFDALVFFVGAIIGIFLFNGFFSELEPLYSMKSPFPDYIYAVAGMSFSQFALLVTVVAVLVFWFSELVEAKFDFSLVSARGNGLWGFSVVILLLASMNLLISHPSARALLSSGPDARKVLLMAEEGLDRLAPETFAREKLSGQKRIAVVDVRSRAEYDTWHISGSVHLPLSSIIDGLQRYREFDRIVICSDGNARSGQAWVALVAAGFKNVFILDGGLSGFVDRILKPVSLREEFLSKADQEEINTWRAMFLGSGMASSAAAPVSSGALTAP